MKRILFFAVLAISAIGFTSCLTDEAYSTPSVVPSKYLVRDTPAGVHDTISYSDTIHVGDTLRATVLLYGGYNNLLEFQASVDPELADFHLLLDSGYTGEHYLTKASDPAKGYLRFAADIYLYPTALWFVPLKTGDLKLSMVLSNTAGEKYSPVNVWLLMRVE